MISRRHPLAVRLNLGGWIAYWSDLRPRLYGWRDPAIRSTAALAAAASFAMFDATSGALMDPAPHVPGFVWFKADGRLNATWLRVGFTCSTDYDAMEARPAPR